MAIEALCVLEQWTVHYTFLQKIMAHAVRTANHPCVEGIGSEKPRVLGGLARWVDGCDLLWGYRQKRAQWSSVVHCECSARCAFWYVVTWPHWHPPLPMFSFLNVQLQLCNKMLCHKHKMNSFWKSCSCQLLDPVVPSLSFHFIFSLFY